MIRASILLVSLSAAALAAPAFGQSHHGAHRETPPAASQAPDTMAPMDHGEHGEPAPPAIDPDCAPEHAAMGHCTPKSAKPAPPPPVGDPDCAPEHAAMGHCTAKSARPAPPPPVGDPDCPLEHAAMGHCTPKPGADTKAATSPSVLAGTDLPAGDAPAPAPPADWYADRIYPKAEMDHARHAMMIENGGQKIAFISLNLAEYQARKGHDGFMWEGEGWYGGDINRLTVKSEGEAVFGEGVESAELQFLYSRAIGPYFNAQAGIRQDLGHGPDRTYAVIGFEGLAPYWFETEGALFLSDKGDLLGRIEGSYDQRITQKLILQPMAEVNFALQDVPESRVGSGLSDVELGLRLRYEIVREFAPYVGVEWARKIGDTARFARADGEDADSISLVVGVKAWF